MKRNILFGLVAMASLFLASCNGDYDDWASPQAFDAESAAAKYGVTFTPGPQADVVMPTSDGYANIVTINSSNEAVSGFTIKSVTIDGKTINATMDNNNVSVKASELSNIIRDEYNSRAYVKRALKVVTTVAANLSNGDAVTIDMAGQTDASFTPYATPAIDPKGYFVAGNFAENGSGWDITKPVMMEKVSDGVYSVHVTTTSDTNWFKFYCASDADGTWDSANKHQMGCAVNGDDTRTGYVVYTDDPENPKTSDATGVQTPVIKGEGQFKITLDMNNLTYTVTPDESKYFLIGNPTGWGLNLSCMLYGEGNNVYSYTYKATNQWDIKVFDGKYYSVGSNDIWGFCWGGVNGSTAASGDLIYANGNADKAGAIGPNENGGWYTFTINMNNNTYSWKAIDAPTKTYNSVSIIGGFNEWKADVDMKQVEKAPHNWYVRATINSDSELKFRANHDWATSWGSTKGFTLGDSYYGPTGGENITVPAGTYDFYLNDITGRWNIVAVK
ncbi:MAG: DUF5115 domain-containing protein [Prevotella sp.]|nr:DUF5115 domain-containing protein [Prevotella sp.]